LALFRARGALWSHADFLRLWSAQTVSAFGARITREGLPLAAVLTIHASPATLGILAALSQGPTLVVGLFAGGFVDRAQRRTILIGSDLARAAVLATVPIAAWMHLLSMPQLYVVAAIAGSLNVLFEIADHAYLPSLIARADLIEGNTKLNVTESIAEIGGPALSGVLVQFLTAPIAIAVNAATYMVSALFLSRIRAREALDVRQARSPGWWHDLSAGASAIFGNPLLRPLFLMSATNACFAPFFSALYIYYAVNVLKLPPSLLGVTIAVGGVGALLGASIASAWIRAFGVGWAIISSGLIAAASAFFIPLAHGSPLGGMAYLMVAQIFGDSFGVVAIVVSTSLRQSILPLNLMGRAGAVFRVGAGAPAIFAALLGGVLGGMIGPRPVMYAAAAGMTISMFWAFFSPLVRLENMPVHMGEAIVDPQSPAS
jgi:hypothetical protein